MSNRLFWLAVVVNMMALSVCALYAGGGPLEIALMPCLHILLFRLHSGSYFCTSRIFLSCGSRFGLV